MDNHSTSPIFKLSSKQLLFSNVIFNISIKYCHFLKAHAYFTTFSFCHVRRDSLCVISNSREIFFPYPLNALRIDYSKQLEIKLEKYRNCFGKLLSFLNLVHQGKCSVSQTDKLDSSVMLQLMQRIIFCLRTVSKTWSRVLIYRIQDQYNMYLFVRVTYLQWTTLLHIGKFLHFYVYASIALDIHAFFDLTQLLAMHRSIMYISYSRTKMIQFHI